MISKKIGTLLKKNTRTKTWWLKLTISLIVSNIFFFYLFSDEKKEETPSGIPEGWVEIQLQAEVLTPFKKNKKILLLHRRGQKKVEGIFKEAETNIPGKITVIVKEEQAHHLFEYQSWEVLPYLKQLSFVRVKGELHEIRY